MKRAKIIGSVILLGLLAGVADAQTNQPAAPLGLGDVPPPIQVADWIKGAPVTSLETGKVYVVEFWATWCVPCKKSIPHLTELAKKYQGEVTFLGVSIWERPREKTDAGINQLVVPFVKSMGDKMDYHVAIDGVAGFMAKHWMEAAQQPGIPTAFVINQEGRIAWIGLPDELGPVLGKIIASTWDIAVEKKRVADVRDKQGAEERAIAAVFKARDAQDISAWVAAVDQAEMTAPNLAKHPDFPSIKLEPLLRSDPARTVAYVKALTSPEGAVHANPDLVWSILRVIPSSPKPGKLAPTHWQAIAVAIAPSVAAAKAREFDDFYDCYADVFSRAGEWDRAVEQQRKAMELLRTAQAAKKEPLNQADKDRLERYQRQLEEMSSRLKK